MFCVARDNKQVKDGSLVLYCVCKWEVEVA